VKQNKRKYYNNCRTDKSPNHGCFYPIIIGV
jgi:hypothetical protein